MFCLQVCSFLHQLSRVLSAYYNHYHVLGVSTRSHNPEFNEILLRYIYYASSIIYYFICRIIIHRLLKYSRKSDPTRPAKLCRKSFRYVMNISFIPAIQISVVSSHVCPNIPAEDGSSNHGQWAEITGHYSLRTAIARYEGYKSQRSRSGQVWEHTPEQRVAAQHRFF